MEDDWGGNLHSERFTPPKWRARRAAKSCGCKQASLQPAASILSLPTETNLEIEQLFDGRANHLAALHNLRQVDMTKRPRGIA
jgi:hypothetical protein